MQKYRRRVNIQGSSPCASRDEDDHGGGDQVILPGIENPKPPAGPNQETVMDSTVLYTPRVDKEAAQKAPRRNSSRGVLRVNAYRNKPQLRCERVASE